MTMIYVSHRMPELFRLCDKISVLRDGQYVGTLPRAEATPDAVVKMMIGRSVADYFPQHVSAKAGEVVLRVSNLSSAGRFRDVNFEVRAGEIVGFAGLVGSGRSEVAKAIFGLDSARRARWRLMESPGSGLDESFDGGGSGPCSRGPQAPGACTPTPAVPSPCPRAQPPVAENRPQVASCPDNALGQACGRTTRPPRSPQ